MRIKNVVRPLKLSLALLASMAIAGSCKAATNPTTVSTTYQGSSENFPNPERGFSISRAYSDKSPNPLTISDLQRIRNTGLTLVRRIYDIKKYRNSELPQSFLNLLKSDFETARQAGIKLVIRFAYNWDSSGTDASKDRILSHLTQMQPIFKDNKDALAYMEAGFIGAWGEWHSSSTGLDNTQDKTTILNKLLSILPSDRMVALRYPRDKMAVFNNSNPLTPQEAFNGTYRARTGAHNDCFVSSIEDMGTYHWSDSNIRESEKNFLNLDNRYVVQGGETCNPSKYDDCPNVLEEMGRMRWSQIETEFHATVLQGWRDQGCMEEIRRRLGYRFRLLNSTLPDRVKPNGTFAISFKVTNDGWASPYNPRSLEVILRNSQTGQEYFLPIPEAVRMWMPGATKEVNVVGGIPASMPSGEYQVLLNLPDPTSRLYKRPEYSIRLANQNVWEASTGYNNLQRKIVVDANTMGSNFTGKQFFKLR